MTEHNYPTQDKFGRQGIYCKCCGAIFYLPEPLAIAVRQDKCLFCGYNKNEITTLRWITRDKEYQPDGEGF